MTHRTSTSTPTLLDAAGIDAPDFRAKAQGRSFHPDANPREYAYAEDDPTF